MKRRVLQMSLALAGLLMLFRFGAPALFFGATGPGPFGNHWLTDAKTPTVLFDADVRFSGAMLIGIGIIFFWAISRIESAAPVIYMLAGAVALGAAARIYARVTYGDPGIAGTIPIVIEIVIPVVISFALHSIRSDVGNTPK
jgi:hypothetical protein